MTEQNRIVTRADVEPTTGDLYLPAGTIVTPGALELAAQRGHVIFVADTPVESAAPGAKALIMRSPSEIAATIDHTNLSPGATRADIAALCREAVEYGFATVCVAPNRTAAAVAELAGSGIAVCGLAGFPMGANTTVTKITEAAQCIAAGAREIDMVAATGLLRDGDRLGYADDIAAVRQAVGPEIVLKVIIETSLLDEADIVRAAVLAAGAGAHYIKTSTGVYGQVRVEDVVLLRCVLPPEVRVKAAGGVRTADQARALLDAGADRLGTSASVAIMRDMSA